MPGKTIDNSEKIQTSSDTVSYAIDCRDDSHLLETSEKEDASTMEHEKVVPSTSAIHSLFSENKLLLDQD